MSTQDLNPSDDLVPVETIVGDLQRWRENSQATIESLAACRLEVEAGSRQFESPQAALEYIDFFVGFIGRAAAEIDIVVAEVPQGVTTAHLDALRQIASNAAAEQRRCLMFRDKWINRPLPYEDVRPLLNEISNGVRDGLDACRQLSALADDLAATFPAADPASPDARALDRRALFTKWFGR